MSTRDSKLPYIAVTLGRPERNPPALQFYKYPVCDLSRCLLPPKLECGLTQGIHSFQLGLPWWLRPTPRKSVTACQS